MYQNNNQMMNFQNSLSVQNEISSPYQPHRFDPFRKEENDNDPTRIKPGINEPEKNDPTRIDIPGFPKVPAPEEDQPEKEASPLINKQS